MNLLHLLQQKFRFTLAGMVDDPEPFVAMVKPTQDAKHGAYQANCAMSLAKVLGKKPRDIAQEIVARLALDGVLEKPEIAGPGFINLRLNPAWLAQQLQHVAKDERLGVARAQAKKTFVIDYSSPNVAKPMHVGHLRSTIIGAAITRLLRFLGHAVVTDNHIGDWGTQFGMLLYGYKHFRDDAALKADPIRELARLYLHVRSLMKADEDDEGNKVPDPVAEAARQETAKLHAGDAENLEIWEMFRPWCLEEIDRIYRRLGVTFDHTLGESFYQPMLHRVVQDLLAKDIAQKSQDAIVVFFEEGKPPALVQKKDGAFTYTTTDLATINYRVETWRPQAILYVVDARQALHFQNLFTIARRWGLEEVELTHVSFGSVLGPDRRPLKTREGGAVSLEALLDEAVQRARKIVDENSAELPEDERQRVAEAVGIGAVKYADLSQNRTSDYVFNWDKMLAMDGNTAAYMQYAYARNRSIFRKGNEDPARLRQTPITPFLETDHERALAVQLLRLEETLAAAAVDYQPNIITAYLWDVAKAYSAFFQHCPVLKADTPMLRESRLLLCDLTARVLQRCLDVLGIQTVERM